MHASPGIVSGLAAASGGVGRSWLSLRVVPSGLRGGFVPGLGFLGGGPRVTRPGGEPFPQRDHLMLAEPDLRECPVVHLVQLQPGIGEILAGQARIQPPGKADQLGRAVTTQRRGHVRVISRLHPAG
jgi:hypothetical protein